jgi:hypothetical protein
LASLNRSSTHCKDIGRAASRRNIESFTKKLAIRFSWRNCDIIIDKQTKFDIGGVS